MKVKDFIAMLSEQDPESEVTIVAQSFVEKADYHYDVTEIVGEDTIVYIDTYYKDEG